MAAGILPVDSNGRILLIKEPRHGKSKYGFIGGKRECNPGWTGLPCLETPFQTASREFREEVGAELQSKTYRQVYWFPLGKYLLFSVNEVPDTNEPRFRWFTRAELFEGFNESSFHEFIVPHLWKILETEKQ